MTLTGVVHERHRSDASRARSSTQFGVMSVTNKLKTEAEARDALEKVLSCRSRSDGRRDTALVYAAGRARLGARSSSGTAPARASTARSWSTSRRRCRRSASTSSRSTFSTPSRSGGCPIARPALEDTVSRGDRRACARASRAPGARCSSAANRWAGGLPRTWPRPTRRCPSPGLVLLGYPLHPPGQPRKAARRAPAVRPPADAVRSRQPRHVRHARRARADPRACSRRRRRCTSSTGGDHSFKLGGKKDPVRQAGVYARASSGRSPRGLQRVGRNQEVLDRCSADQVLLDDSLEHGRIAAARTKCLPDTRPRSARPRRCAGNWPSSAECRHARTGRALSGAFLR